MTSLEVYAFFIMPFLVLALCLAVVAITRWQDSHEDERRSGLR